MIARALIGLIGLYKRHISRHLPKRCRFHPTCADYAAEALRRHGLMRGGSMAAARLLRCNPLHPGGLDPVPGDRDSYLLTGKEWGIG